MAQHLINMNEQLAEYLQTITLREPEPLKQLREAAENMPGHHIQVSPEQAQFLGLLVQLTGAHKILELGTFAGYSAMAMALQLPEGGELTTVDVSEKNLAVAKNHFHEAGLDTKINTVCAKAGEYCQQLLDSGQEETFDMIFIDADKVNYDAYYEFALQLTKPSGLIMIDNVLWYGKVADPSNQQGSTKTLRALNQKIHKDDRVNISVMPIGDGLTLARKW